MRIQLTILFVLAVSVLRSEERNLIDFSDDGTIRSLVPRGVELRAVDSSLEVRGQASLPIEGGVLFPLSEANRDLSRYGYIEADITNTGDQPLRFSFWALSGNGWGGVSTFTPETGPTAGREVLPAGHTGRFKISLFARYPGTAVYTGGINPASVRWLDLVIGDGRSPPSVTVRNIRACGVAPGPVPDASRRVLVPDIVAGPPSAGHRVYEQLPGWKRTGLRHVLTLPAEWTPEGKFPILVEYTGNVFYHKFCHSTGYTDQGNLAYGLARGATFICLNLPFVSQDGKSEQPDGWGSIAKTEDYCCDALQWVVGHYCGDPRKIFFVGFSRGEYAANYLALRDDRISRLWCAFVGTNPGRPWQASDGKGWKMVGLGWDERAARLGSRPWFLAPANLGEGVHVDVEYLEDRPSTVAVREWLMERAIEQPPVVRKPS